MKTNGKQSVDKNVTFVDIHNVDVMNYKCLLKMISDTGIEKVPAGYALRIGGVLLQLTRHAFSLSLDGRVVLEKQRKFCKWSDADLLRSLSVGRLVQFKIDPRHCCMQFAKSDFGQVVRVGNDGTLVGGIMASLIFLDRLKLEGVKVDTRSITFRVPKKEVFAEYYKNVAIREKGVRYFMVANNEALRVFIKERRGQVSTTTETITKDMLLQNPQVIDVDSSEASFIPYDPMLCICVRGMEIKGQEITSDIHMIATLNEACPLPKESDEFLKLLDSNYPIQNPMEISESQE